MPWQLEYLSRTPGSQCGEITTLSKSNRLGPLARQFCQRFVVRLWGGRLPGLPRRAKTLALRLWFPPTGNKPQAASHRTASRWTALLEGYYCILRRLCIGLHFWPPSSCPPPLLTSLSFVPRQKLKRALSTENVALALLGAAAECVNRMSISLGRKG